MPRSVLPPPAPLWSSYPVIFEAEQIYAAIVEKARWLNQKFLNQSIVMVINLEGAAHFARLLLQATEEIDIPAPEIDTKQVKLVSYQGTASTGTVKTLIPLASNLQGQHVVIVEDITDSGLVARTLIDLIKNQKPASITFLTLIDKPHCHPPIVVNEERPAGFFEFAACLTYRGDKFLIGCGLDHEGQYRNLPNIRAMPLPSV